MNSIAVDHISKRYGTLQALDDITFTVSPGEVLPRRSRKDIALPHPGHAHTPLKRDGTD